MLSQKDDEGNGAFVFEVRYISFYFLFFLCIGSVLFADFIPSIFGSYADQRLLLSMSLVALSAIGIFRLSSTGSLTTVFILIWPLTLLLSVFLVSALHSSSHMFYVVEPVFFVLYFLAFVLLGVTLREAGLVREVVQAAVLVATVTCFFYAAMTITVYLFAVTDDFSRLDHIIPWGFVNIRYWSHVGTWLVPLFPLAALLVPWKNSRLWQLGVAFTAAIWWWVIFMSASRGTMAGVVIGFFFACLCFGRAALPWVKVFVRFLFYGVIAWLLLSALIPSLVFDDLQIRGLKANSSGRMPLWQEAWAMSLQNFPFGMGPQSWLTHDIITEAYRSSPKFGHPHNMYLMWAAEYGWISIAGLLLLGGYGLRHLWRKASTIRKSRDPEGLWLVAFTVSVTAALVHAGASAVFIAPGSMLIGLLVLTVFWALISPERSRSVALDVSKGRFKVAEFLFLLVFLVAGGFWLQDVLRYQQAMEDDLEYYQEELSLGHLPRFWFHGNFPRHPSQMP